MRVYRDVGEPSVHSSIIVVAAYDVAAPIFCWSRSPCMRARTCPTLRSGLYISLYHFFFFYLSVSSLLRFRTRFNSQSAPHTVSLILKFRWRAPPRAKNRSSFPSSIGACKRPDDDTRQAELTVHQWRRWPCLRPVSASCRRPVRPLYLPLVTSARTSLRPTGPPLLQSSSAVTNREPPPPQR